MGQKRVWRCHRCQNIVGPTTSFTSSDAKGELGTDWQKFYSFSEYKTHCQQIHGEMLPMAKKPDSAGRQRLEADNCFGASWG